MKKLFTLLTLALMSIGSAWAGDVYKITFNTVGFEQSQSTAGYFTFPAGSKKNTNSKFNGCTYDGIEYNMGLKMEGSTEIDWTATADATVTIVQSTWEKSGAVQTIKLDGNVLETSSASTDIAGCLVYTITDVASGTHAITRGSGESGLFAIYVEYTGAVKTQLTEPEITAEGSSVTIGAVENATKVTYTTDGTNPTAESTEYTEPFVVEDGTEVKAIAIGDDADYINSEIAAKTIYLTGITISVPEINQFNGTVAIACANVGAAIEYSTDGGSNWTAYSRAFTVTEDTDIQARASREGCTTSDVAQATVTAVAASTKTKTLVMAFGAFDADKKVMTGKAGDDAEGFTLTMLTDQDKSWSGRNKVTIAEIDAERTTICGSNGVQCRLDMPAGIKATQLRLYSYVNGPSISAANSAWKEVNGENLSETLSTVPMGAYNDVDGYLDNPDVRIFPLDNVEGSLTFTNGGTQTCFVIVLDVIDTNPVNVSISEAGLATFSNKNTVELPAGLDAYYATQKDENTILLNKIEDGIIAAGEGVVLAGAAGDYAPTPSTANKAKEAANLLKANLTAGTPSAETYYTLAAGPVFKLSAGGTLAAGKAYLELPSEARTLNVVFENEATGITEVAKMNAENEMFNLNGQRVVKAQKGLFIQNGKKILVK